MAWINHAIHWLHKYPEKFSKLIFFIPLCIWVIRKPTIYSWVQQSAEVISLLLFSKACCTCWTHLEGVSDNVGTLISWVNNIDLLQGENVKMNTCVKVNQNLRTEGRGKVTGTNMGKSRKWKRISSWLDTWNDRRIKGHKKAVNLSLPWLFNALTSSYITWADWRKKLLKVTVYRFAPVIFISFIICIIFYHFSYAK